MTDMKHILHNIALASVALLLTAPVAAQQKNFDKADADMLVYEQLAGNTGGENYHRTLVVNMDKLADTNEERIKLLRGKSFQISSLRSDIYIDTATGKPVFDRRYPMESAVSLLMNVVDKNCKVELTQHLYGNRKKKISTALSSVYFVLAADMDIYCNITKIDKDMIEADLVMHNRERNVIHLFVVHMPQDQMFADGGEIRADLYANIPQNDIKNIYSKKRK